MPKIKLDAPFCRIAQCKAGARKTDYWDTTIPGFVLEVRPTGGRTFYLRYMDEHGRQRQLKIADGTSVKFEQARKKAEQLRSEVVLGGDPAGAKKDRKAVPLYSDLATQHLAHVKTYQRSYSTTKMYMERHITPRWAKLRLDEIKPQDVAKWLGEKAGEGLKPASIEKIRVIFGRSFELAKQWNMPGSGLNPTRGLPRPKFDNARQRYVTAEEAQRLRWAVELSRNTQLKHIVGLLLLTGARVGELLQAKASDVDVERKQWFIPMTKTGRSRHVSLSQAAIDIIKQLPKVGKSPYLVPNPDTGKPFVSIKHAWQAARERADLPGLRIHDLRHSAASFMINAGVDLYAVGKVLGHADHKSTMRYSHLADETLLAAVEAGADGLKVDWAQTL